MLTRKWSLYGVDVDNKSSEQKLTNSNPSHVQVCLEAVAQIIQINTSKACYRHPQQNR